MPGGRPPKGPSLVDGIEAPELAKLRLKTILEVISGERTVDEACDVLRVSRTRFYELQSKVIAGALDALTPLPTGRPRADAPRDERIEKVEKEMTRMKLELHAARIREEIALTMPHVLTSQAQKKKRGGKKPW